MTNQPATEGLEMQIAVYGPNLSTRDETFHVHSTDCADPKRRPLYRGHRPMIFEADSALEVCEEVYSDIIAENAENGEPDGGEHLLSDFKFFPCTGLV